MGNKENSTDAYLHAITSANVLYKKNMCPGFFVWSYTIIVVDIK